MSPFEVEHTIYFCYDFVVNWNWTVPCSFVEIPPSDDVLEVRFIFCKGTQHALGPKIDPGDAVVESYVIHLSEKVITIRPSELCGKDTTSIMQSNSMRLIVDFINTHYPPPKKNGGGLRSWQK
ncbi:hypothetical protein M0R45_035272 [Rubus argutus]|uniref:Uncharacterized protein n=1 Tax=Rubus argutus TaxID=59490 RepID=A0AAW1VTQ6_RUBAR